MFYWIIKIIDNVEVLKMDKIRFFLGEVKNEFTHMLGIRIPFSTGLRKNQIILFFIDFYNDELISDGIYFHINLVKNGGKNKVLFGDLIK